MNLPASRGTVWKSLIGFSLFASGISLPSGGCQLTQMNLPVSRGTVWKSLIGFSLFASGIYLCRTLNKSGYVYEVPGTQADTRPC
jgi:hypothetical protein